MIYENNLRALQEARPDIYTYVVDKDFSCNDRAVVETAKNGELIVKYINNGKEYYLNSRYNPMKEAEKFMTDEILMPDESVLTIIGLANGSFAREFLNKNEKNVQCVIFEPSISIFMQVIKNIDIRDIILDERVILVIRDVNESLLNVCFTKLIQIYNKKTNHHIILPKYVEAFPEACADMQHMLDEQYDRLRAETFTVASCGAKTCANSIYNMRYLPGCRSGREYVEAFPEELPVIIVSAGPSLVKNVELLKEAKGKALILVVDTAIPKVMSRGITPDMVISVDYNKSLRHFNSEGLDDVFFLTDMDMNTAVLDHLRPKNIIFNSSDSLVWDHLFKMEGSEIWTVDSGGSVATAAIAHMMAWGFKKIILVGQDLALTGNRVHADEGEAVIENLPWPTTYVKGMDGNDILTRKDYCIYIRWIEEIGYKYSDIELIDATEGGALKQHTTIMTLREAIDTYCNKEYDIRAILESKPRIFEGERRQLVVDALDKLKNNMRNIKKQLMNGAADCRMGALMLENGDYNIRELKRINASIGKLDEKLMNSDERIYFAKYVSGADIDLADDMYLEEEDDIKESIRMYNKSEKYYQSIADAIPKIIEIVDNCKEKLVQEK